MSLRKTCFTAAALVAIAASGANGLQASEEISTLARGASGSITILRDRYGVPHIRAGNEADALFGLGYIHAHDRLWQMEYQRRLGAGRLSEILGESAIATDKLFRTLGLQHAAECVWANYRGRERQLLSSYVAGINAFLSKHRNRSRPAEFIVLGFEPEPWKPEDVLLWVKVLAWIVGDNWDQELLRVQLTQKLGPDKAAQLMPVYTSDGPIIIPEEKQYAANRARQKSRSSHVPFLPARSVEELLSLNHSIMDRFGLGGQGLGSNNWVLSGSRTTTGKPILASDPHLPAQTPSLFYLAHITGGDLDAIGGTLPGAPMVLMGHNGQIAWGFTNANADVQDLFAEHINNRNEAEYDGAWEPLQVTTETIKIKDQADISLTVRVSRHGPLLSDLINPNGPALALRWTAFDAEDDSGVRAYLSVGRARNWKEFTMAFKRYGSHPQNTIYGDAEGNIGYLLPGSVPLRRKGDGTAPVPGWTSEYEWVGYVPFDELPHTFNPPQGYIVTANNRIAGDSYPYRISNGFAAPFRAARIAEMIESKPRHSLDDVEEMQSDMLAVHARDLLPIMLQVKPLDARSQKAMELLRGWDYRVPGDSAPATIFEAWYTQFADRLFSDELGETLWRSYSDNLYMVGMAVSKALQEQTRWCDDVRTVPTETCGDTLSAALSDALTKMAGAQGSENVTAWHWDKVHEALFPHAAFDSDPVLQPLFSRSIPTGGDKFTVNVGGRVPWSEYNQKHAAVYRQVVDFSDLHHSQFIITPGQSGDPFSRHYDDLMKLWQSGRYLPMLYSYQTVANEASEQLLLRPE